MQFRAQCFGQSFVVGVRVVQPADNEFLVRSALLHQLYGLGRESVALGD